MNCCAQVHCCGLASGARSRVLYSSSFSMRSTCVMSMRRQQYLIRPSASMASLRGQQGIRCHAPACHALTLALAVGMSKGHYICTLLASRMLQKRKN